MPLAKKAYERLSAQDSSFVMFDAGRGQLAVGAIAIFAPGSSSDDSGIGIKPFRDHVASRLHLLPHYRQRLEASPIQSHPIWIDDDHFDLTRHVRHAGLPAPGSRAQLKELAAEIFSRPLDLSRPVWELWLIEGLQDGGFAIVAKVHHCIVDGVTGVNILTALLSPNANQVIAEAPPWKPKPRPSGLEFLSEGFTETAEMAADTLRTVGSAIFNPVDTVNSLLEVGRAGVTALQAGLRPHPDTPLNRPITRQRRVDWCDVDLNDVKDLKKRLDGTVNDVVLCLLAGALRRTFKRRRVSLRSLDLRVIVPVDTRSPADDTAGNKVAAWFLDLPVSESSAKKRFDKIREQTRLLKRSNAEQGIDMFLRFADWIGSSRLPYWGVNLVQMLRPYNLIITNVHGPTVPLYLLGARLDSFYPTVPLFENQGIAVAAMSYVDRISFGILADWDLVPDLQGIAEEIGASLEELRGVAYSTNLPSRTRSMGKKARRRRSGSGGNPARREISPDAPPPHPTTGP